MANRKLRPPTIAELSGTGRFKKLEQIVAASFSAIAPSERVSVTDAALRYTRVPSGGNYGRKWDLDITPYLAEPQDALTSRDYQGTIFVGPARTGKSQMGLNWLGHTIKHDPTDMLFVQMNRDNARKWSKGDLDRFLRLSPEIRKHQLINRKDDNTYDKEFDSGMRLLVSYPTVENLSAITVKYVFFMDYDRMTDDVGGEGNPYDLGRKRTTTFKRAGMAAAESSPNPDKEILDPKWIAETLHQAPPVRGIFELYNRGDRRRYYWRCPQCHEAFEPDFSLLKYPDSKDIMDAAEQTFMVCPHDGFPIPPAMKQELNSSGKWIRDGMMWKPETAEVITLPGNIARRSTIASFWIKGPAAGYQTWESLVVDYLTAQKAYTDTGDEGPLRKTVTADQGLYYIPKSRLSERAPEDLKDKAEFWGSSEDVPTIPKGVRFLIATIDVQINSFVAQVHGFMDNGDIVIIDSFKLRWSSRVDRNGEKMPMEPAAYPEDWAELIPQVMERKYGLSGHKTAHMRIRAVGCDSGGAAGVTTQAYRFWRSLKGSADGAHRRFILVKGDGDTRAVSSRPRAMTTWPDSHKKDQYAAARGDVPVLRLNTNVLKDQLAGMLARRAGQDLMESEHDSVGGMLRYPNWLPDWFYRQMTNEIRTEKGWRNPAKRRNETWDLAYYALALSIRPMESGVPFVHFGYDRMDFANPPGWAADWEKNDLVVGMVADGVVRPEKKDVYDTLAELGKDLL